MHLLQGLMDKGENLSKKMQIGNSLAVQLLGLCTSTAVAPGGGLVRTLHLPLPWY